MAGLREIALTVEERGRGRFHWALLEASTDDGHDTMAYRCIASAAQPQPTYSSALAIGIEQMRRWMALHNMHAGRSGVSLSNI